MRLGNFRKSFVVIIEDRLSKRRCIALKKAL
ncbi:hypothetical protein NEOC65_000334 [Neochlamydia sp. AcF65]|nr:hypothetical protein [Neochlamydia sp. AcF65]